MSCEVVTFETMASLEESAPSARRRSEAEIEHAGAAFTCRFLERLHPAIPASTLRSYQALIKKHEIQVTDLRSFGHEELKELGFTDVVHNARILTAVNEGEIHSDPPQQDGKPVEVQVRVGMSNIGSIDTVNQTAAVKFFLDLYWHDPSLIGLERESVPSYIWRPDAYVFNALAGSSKEAHPPVLMDSDTGLMLYALQFECTISNPMDLSEFPFDSDAIVIHFMQAESQSSSEYIFVPWKEDATVAARCFFDIDAIPEFVLRGFSFDTWCMRGGGPNEFAQMFVYLHVKRMSSYYMWKIVLPLFLSTLLCFSAFFFELDNLSDRNATSLTMFLATAALLYVVSSLLPKTSFLTRVDKFVVVSLMIQFVVAALSWIIVGGFGSISEKRAQNIDDVGVIALPVMYIFVLLFYFVPPIVHAARFTANTRPEYPFTHLLDKEQHLDFHPFVWYHNVFI
eukprot:m.53337 g.53337  ORF g.53337 m.53337 type:complete len:454 (+) comp13552_c0_seq2:168-1529(+)